MPEQLIEPTAPTGKSAPTAITPVIPAVQLTPAVQPPAESDQTQPAPPTQASEYRLKHILVLAVTAIVAMAVGIGGTVLVMVVGEVGKPRYTYTVQFFLTKDSTSEQQAAIRAELSRQFPKTTIQFTNHEQADNEFKEMFKGHDLAATPGSLPEYFDFETAGTKFDCSKISVVRGLPGVDEFQIGRASTGDEAAFAKVYCK